MAADTDTNTNPAVRTLAQTQATGPQTNKLIPVLTTQTGGQVSNEEIWGAPTNTTVIAGQADGVTPNNTATQKTTDTAANIASALITPRDNVLDRFSSYTYRASVYLLTPSQYRTLVTSTKKTVNGYNLLFQSGGAPVNQGGFQGSLSPNNQAIAADAEAGGFGAGVNATSIPGAGQADAGRNPAFDLDFYIDSVTIETLTAGKSTQSAHSAASLKFTVVEPNGITLIDRLYEAVQDHAPKTSGGAINYSAAAYLMVIRFYGYDENGNLVSGLGGADPAAGNTDPNAIVEKFIPFRIGKINWSVSSKLVSYDFECVPYSQMIAASTRRGTIPYDVQLTDISVGKLLEGTAQYASVTAANKGPGSPTSTLDSSGRRTSASDPRIIANQQKTAPPKANAAASAKKSIRQGLLDAINDFQKSLCTGPNPVYSVPDEYEIVFAAGAEDIRDATLVLPGDKKENAQTPMAAATSESPSNLSQNKISKDNTARNFSITAGMQIVQAIELAIRNSSYIYKQAVTQVNAESNEELASANDRPPVEWFNITFKAEPKEPYDELRNDYAQKITFIVNKYYITNYDSKYFGLSKFRGVHKSYPYWFTGKNSAIIDYQETLNSLYNITVSGSNPKNSLAEIQRRKVTSSMRDIPFYNYQAASSESRQGSQGKGNEPASSIAESLYSPGDLALSRVRIVGDPAWIQQGSFAGGIVPDNFTSTPFNPDGTINYDSQQVMFEVVWKRPDDYDINVGTINPSSKRGNLVQTTQSRVYQCRKVINEFKQGKFEQTIEGSLYLYLKPDATNKAATAPVPNTNENPDAQRVSSSLYGLDRVNATTPTSTSTPGGLGLNLTNPASIVGQSNLRLGGGIGLRAPGSIVTNAGAIDNPNILKQAAQYGKTPSSVMPAPALTGDPGVSSATLNASPPGPKDTVGYASPPGAATSDGETIATTNPNINILRNPNASQAGGSQLISKEA